MGGDIATLQVEVGSVIDRVFEMEEKIKANAAQAREELRAAMACPTMSSDVSSVVGSSRST